MAPIVYTRGIILNARGCNSWNRLEDIRRCYSWLTYFPRTQLCHGCPQNTHIAIPEALQGASSHGHRQACGEAPDQHCNQRIAQADEDYGLPPKAIRGSTPRDASEALAYGKDGRGKASPACDVIFRDAKPLYHLREVGEDRGQCNGLCEATYCCAKC